MKLQHKDYTVEFEPFPPVEGHTRVRKIRLEGQDGVCEGIWVEVREEDLPRYSDYRSKQQPIVCCLMNQSLAGPAWGTYMIALTQGDDCPLAKTVDMRGNMLASPESEGNRWETWEDMIADRETTR